MPTPPPSVAGEDIPKSWVSKMGEIEEWVLDYYGAEEDVVGDFNRRFVADDVWRVWQVDRAEHGAEDEDSTEHLWEQTYKALTLLSPEADLTKFNADYSGDQVVGQYNSETREITLRMSGEEFDLLAELTYVHEFAHHLQNQIYDYQPLRDCYRGDVDAFNAVTALIEGDATRTEIQYIRDVVGTGRYQEYFEGFETGDEASSDEPAMYRYRHERSRFIYGEGTNFVFDIAVISECENCDTERLRIDDAFRIPPVTTEQILDTFKYLDREARVRLRLEDGVMGDVWEARDSSTVGKSRWLALLVALADADAREIKTDLPEWRGDYSIMFEDDGGRALLLRVVQWDNRKYADSLVNALDGRTQLIRTQTPQLSTIDDYYDFYEWHGEAGSIALGVTIDRVDRFRTMFLAVGPDPETVDNAVRLARESLIIK